MRCRIIADKACAENRAIMKIESFDFIIHNNVYFKCRSYDGFRRHTRDLEEELDVEATMDQDMAAKENLRCALVMEIK